MPSLTTVIGGQIVCFLVCSSMGESARPISILELVPTRKNLADIG